MRDTRYQTRQETEDWTKEIGIKEEADQAQAEWIKQAEIADLANRLEDFYECQGEVDRSSGLADV